MKAVVKDKLFSLINTRKATIDAIFYQPSWTYNQALISLIRNPHFEV